MTYPATNSKEASELLIDVSNQMHEIVNEDATTEVITESGLVPSVRKALADTFLFQDPIAWNQGSDETAFNQLRTFNDNIYWAPTATTLNPIPMGATPIGDSNWKLAPVDVSREWTLQELTRSQNEVIGGKIFPLDDSVLQNGDTVPVGTTHLRVDIGGIPEILKMEPQSSGLVSSLTETSATIGGVDIELLTQDEALFRSIGDVRGWGVYPDVDCTQKLNDLADKIRADGLKIKLTAQPGNYPISGDVNLRRIALHWDGKFVPSNGAKVILGGWSQFRPQNTQYIRGSSGQVDLRGAKGQVITVIESPLVRLYAENSESTDNNTSVAYNHIALGRVTKLKIQGQGITGVADLGGWVNENHFLLQDVVEIEIGTEIDEDYKHNNNRFYGGTFEGASVKVTMDYAVNNTMYDARFEAINANSIEFGSNSYNNRIFVSWTASDAAYPTFNIPYIDNGIGNTVTSNDNSAYQIYPLYYISSDTLQMDDDTTPTKYNLLNVGDRDFNDPRISDGGADITRPSANLLSIPQFQYICTTPYTPCSTSGDSFISIVLKGNTPPAGIRCRVYGYDKDLNPLTPQSGDMNLKGVGLVDFESAFPAANVSEIEFRINRKDCAFVRIAIRNGNGTLDFSSLQVSIRNPASNSAPVNGNQSDRMGGMIPIFNPQKLS